MEQNFVVSEKLFNCGMQYTSITIDIILLGLPKNWIISLIAFKIAIQFLSGNLCIVAYLENLSIVVRYILFRSGNQMSI